MRRRAVAGPKAAQHPNREKFRSPGQTPVRATERVPAKLTRSPAGLTQRKNRSNHRAMGRIIRGLFSAGSWGVCLVAALAALGCSSSDNNNAAPSGCGTQLNPGEFKVSAVSPATGASVPNSGVVQTFTIDGEAVSLMPALGLAATHTAGDVTPNPITWTFSLSATGKDSIYTSAPLTWATAPGHVELDIGGLFQNQTSGCVSRFPGPMFSYDVTAP
jgi:hypothetical protein